MRIYIYICMVAAARMSRTAETLVCSRSRLVIPRDAVACLLVSPRSVWAGPLERVGSGSRMYDDGKSGRCRFVGDWTCSIFIDHVAVSDLRSVFTIPPNLPIRLHHTPRVTCIPPRATLPCTRAPLLSSNSYTHWSSKFAQTGGRVGVWCGMGWI